MLKLYTSILSFHKILFVLFLALLFLIGSRPYAFGDNEAATTEPDWLEPQGLNLATLTGLLPESVLQDSAIFWNPGKGIVTYVSGVVSGETIEVTVKYDTTNPNEVWCTAEPPHWDHSGTVQPASTIRVFSNGTDVTDKLRASYTYNAAGKIKPIRATNTINYRYPDVESTLTFTTDGSAELPANRGCSLTLVGAPLPNLTAVFTMPKQNNIKITETYRHVKNDLHTYIGGGVAGDLDALRNQMLTKYGGRHDAILKWEEDVFNNPAALAGVSESDYILVKSPGSIHDEFGGTGDSFGTFRVAFNGLKNGFNVEWPGQDHQSMKLIPRRGHWLDSSLTPTKEYLDFFDALYPRGTNKWENFDSIKSLEKFLIGTLAYDPCMTSGGCSTAILEEVYNYTYSAEVIFYKVERVRDGGLVQIPLRSVGNTYSPTRSANIESLTPDRESAPINSDRGAFSYFVYLPTVIKPDPPPPPDDLTAECPCGWFDTAGQMLDYVNPP